MKTREKTKELKEKKFLSALDEYINKVYRLVLILVPDLLTHLRKSWDGFLQ